MSLVLSTKHLSKAPWFSKGYLGFSMLTILSVAVVDVVWMMALGVSFTQQTLAFAAISVACLLIVLPYVRSERLGTLIQGYALLMIAWPALRLFNHLTFSLTGPVTDQMLLTMDEALGFSWLGYVTWLNDHPRLLSALDWVYGSLTPFSIFGFVAVAILGTRRAAEEFLTLFVVTAVAVSVFGILMPAYGPMIHLQDVTSQLDAVRNFGWQHFPHYEALRGEAPLALTLENLPGLTTFPSFHTAMGIILVYAMRESWITLIPATAYSAAMIAGTPVFGSHYFVDLIAGTGLTVIAILIVRAFGRMEQAEGKAFKQSTR